MLRWIGKGNPLAIAMIFPHRRRTPLSPSPFPLKGEGEFAENLGVWGGGAAPYTQIFDFSYFASRL